MAIRLKARSVVPGEVRLADNVLSELLAVTNILYNVERGDDNKGTYVAPVQGQVLAPAQGGTAYGAGSGTNGTLTFADTTYVLNSVPDYGIAGTGKSGTATLTAAGNVKAGTGVFGVDGTSVTPTYNPDFPSKNSVLTTDTVDGEAGGYVAPVQAGYSALAPGYGAGGLTSGTLAAAKIRDTTYGTLADSSVLVAAGGTFDEAARNTDPGEANVSDGVTYKILDVGKEGTLVGGDYATGYADGKAYIVAGLVLPDTDLVDAPTMYGVNLAGYEAYYLEGTGLNQATLTAALAAAGLITPGGSFTQTVTVKTVGAVAIQGASVYLIDVSGTIIDIQTTVATGIALPSADAGTYTLKVVKSGYTTSSTTITITAAAPRAVTMSALSFTPPTDEDQVTGWGYVYDGAGVVEPGATVYIEQVTAGARNIYDSIRRTLTADATGLASGNVWADGSEYRISRDGVNWSDPFAPEDDGDVLLPDSYRLPGLLGTS